MKPEHKDIIRLLTEYLEENPDIRFGQALFNLDITQFADIKKDYNLRDIHNDSDCEILNRITERLKL